MSDSTQDIAPASMNKLPTPPGWVDLVDQLAIEASDKAEATVLLLAVVPGGKTCISVAGATGEFVELMARENLPRFLFTLAMTMQQALDAQAKETAP